MPPAHGRVGASGISSVFDLPSKKLSLQKCSDLYFVNLFLKNRRIEFNPIKPYDALRASRQNFSETDLALKLERVGESNEGMGRKGQTAPSVSERVPSEERDELRTAGSQSAGAERRAVR